MRNILASNRTNNDFNVTCMQTGGYSVANNESPGLILTSIFLPETSNTDMLVNATGHLVSVIADPSSWFGLLFQQNTLSEDGQSHQMTTRHRFGTE